MSSSDMKSILIVDDQPENIDVLSNILRDEYNVMAATNGEKALKIIQTKTVPDLVLLDVMMPNMDGYEVCQRIKDNPDTSDVDVIFVSALDSSEKVIAGYEAGGSDYVTKPVRPDEIIQKVRLALENRKAHADLKNDHKQAMDTAMTAITNVGEQGVVLDFMIKSFAVNTIENLARQIVDSNAGYGLESSVQIRTREKSINVSSDEPMTPLEKEFLYKVKDVGRLREKGDNFIANFSSITMLIKNMPEDEDKRGRLRDHLAILLEGAESRLKALEVEGTVIEIVNNAKEALQDIEEIQKENKKRAVQIMDGVMMNLEESFMSYGLTEEQETLLLGVVKAGEEKTLDNFEEGQNVDEKMRSIIESLEQSIKS